MRVLVNSQNVNARDTSGRKSSPLHFAAGTTVTFYYIVSVIHGINSDLEAKLPKIFKNGYFIEGKIFAKKFVVKAEFYLFHVWVQEATRE